MCFRFFSISLNVCIVEAAFFLWIVCGDIAESVHRFFKLHIEEHKYCVLLNCDVSLSDSAITIGTASAKGTASISGMTESVEIKV